MNLKNTNSGGWESSYMRNDICPQFLELLPSDLQNAINETTKYTDNVGNRQYSKTITATKDKIFLLNHYETGGNRSSGFGNSLEANYTTQYNVMYSSNTNRTKYKHSSSSSSCWWWSRSPYLEGSRTFCDVTIEGNVNDNHSGYYSGGFSPAFTIY